MFPDHDPFARSQTVSTLLNQKKAKDRSPCNPLLCISQNIFVFSFKKEMLGKTPETEMMTFDYATRISVVHATHNHLSSQIKDDWYETFSFQQPGNWWNGIRSLTEMRVVLKNRGRNTRIILELMSEKQVLFKLTGFDIELFPFGRGVRRLRY